MKNNTTNKLKLVFLILIGVTLCSCGGSSEPELEEWEFQVQFCEAQDGKAEILHVMNVDTGENYIDVKCVIPKTHKRDQCKLGGEC